MLSVTRAPDGFVAVDAADTVVAEDCRRFVRDLTALAERDRDLRLLIRLDGLRGWDPAAPWREVKLPARHHRAFARVAVVGPGDRARWMRRISQPFVAAHVRYFDVHEAEAAAHWLLSE